MKQEWRGEFYSIAQVHFTWHTEPGANLVPYPVAADLDNVETHMYRFLDNKIFFKVLKCSFF